jgi:hypothetical protein
MSKIYAVYNIQLSYMVNLWNAPDFLISHCDFWLDLNKHFVVEWDCNAL